MELVEVRRLTGPNLLLDGPAAVLEARCAEPRPAASLLGRRVDDVLGSLRPKDPAWQTVRGGQHAVRVWHEDAGFTFALPLPVDLLYAGCAVVEHAWDAVVEAADAGEDLAELATGPAGWRPGAEVIDAIRAETREERDEALLRLLAAADRRGVAGVWDDDRVSVGLGRGSRSWPRDAVPHPDEVPWHDVHDVPVAMVTGTNGKSTTVRMLAGILRAAGLVAGHSSTDGIVVGGEVVEAGDWSGPGGGRTVARDQRVGACVLETARGGLLRRGLPLDRADVAVVTNVAVDHLGEYGIDTVDGMARAKLVVGRAVRDGGVLVTNAEDGQLLRHAPTGARTWWFALDPGVDRLEAAVAAGATVATVVEDRIVLRDADDQRDVVAVAEVPATFDGAARHNLANALAATLAATAMGVGTDEVAEGLRSFTPDADTNPGRANRHTLDGVTVLVDFAHNEAAVRAVAELATELTGGRALVLFSQPGDRDDAALATLAAAVHASGAERYVVADVPGYLRGRDPMEVPQLLAAALVERGVDPDDVVEVTDAVVGTRVALDWAQPGDVVLLLVLEHRDEVTALLSSRGATAG